MVIFFFQAEDGIRDAQESRGLGDVYKRQPQGRPRQRAYNDALRDLVTPLMGHPPVMRVAVPDLSLIHI